MSTKFLKLESNNIDDKNRKYTNIVTLFFDDINDKFTSRKIYSSQKAKFDDQFELDKFTQNKVGSINFDKNLKELCLLNKKNIDLLLLLRCKVSNSIKDLILNLHEKYSDKYNLNWDKKDMLSFVLEDDGRRSIRPTHNINNFGKKNLVSFNYEFIDSEIERINEQKLEEFERIHKIKIKESKRIDNLKKKGKKDNLIKTKDKKKYFRLFPFSAEVIYTFDHLRNAEISTWTKYKLYDDRFLKQYIHRHGKLLLISKWGLLSANPLSTTLKAWKEYGSDKSIDFSVLERTIKYYLDNWEENKKNFKRKNYNKWDPTKDHNFLDEDQLYILGQAANALRKYHGLNKFIDNKIKKSSKENDNEKMEIFNFKREDSKIPSTEFDDFIMGFIEKKKKNKLEIRLQEDMKTWGKFPERKKAWILLSKLNIEDTYMRENIEGELKQIAFKCKGKNGEGMGISWLTKRFLYDKNLSETFIDLKDTLISITESKDFVENFNKENKDNKVNLFIINEIKNKIILKQQSDKNNKQKINYIFDDLEKLKEITINFQNFFNPKRGRKREFILLVREILKENGIIK